ncbi:hypothetical protein SDC9_186785 [bioreactor metagenome]|uniref:Uncharacterized protein n=1 Tax=bioreactor metagenome TaxID=1076179 RepID=A0A645HJV3_9ZZZZ
MHEHALHLDRALRKGLEAAAADGLAVQLGIERVLHVVGKVKGSIEVHLLAIQFAKIPVERLR